MIAIIDTNVIYKASIPISKLDGDDLDCAHKCVCFLDRFVKNHANILVLDRGRRILKEYINAYKEFKHMCPGYAIVFFRTAVGDKLGFHVDDSTEITPNGDSFCEYPSDARLLNFDRSDKKFIALANAHASHPQIVEGTDSKWWGIKDVLAEHGISVLFVDEDYIRRKYEKKMIKSVI